MDVRSRIPKLQLLAAIGAGMTFFAFLGGDPSFDSAENICYITDRLESQGELLDSSRALPPIEFHREAAPPDEPGVDESGPPVEEDGVADDDYFYYSIEGRVLTEPGDSSFKMQNATICIFQAAEVDHIQWWDLCAIRTPDSFGFFHIQSDETKISATHGTYQNMILAWVDAGNGAGAFSDIITIKTGERKEFNIIMKTNDSRGATESISSDVASPIAGRWLQLPSWYMKSEREM